MAGVAGGCGSAFLAVADLLLPGAIFSPETGDFVSVPMASFATVGGIQGRLLPASDLSDFIGLASEGLGPENCWAWDLTRVMTPSSFDKITYHARNAITKAANFRAREDSQVDRRSLLKSALFASALPAVQPDSLFGLSSAAAAESTSPAWRHGVSKFGDLKYTSGFAHFDYVNAAAPKGGRARQVVLGTFDNFNIVVAETKGTLVSGANLIYDTLLVPALDEVSSEYGLLAEAVRYPDDFSSVTFRLRAEAKWHDGTPVTPEDVIFSFNAWKKYSPSAGENYRHVAKAEKAGSRDVTFTADSPGNRELPLLVGHLSILPQHWWEGTDKDGKQRNIGETTLEPPLGSGAYRVKEFTAGRTAAYERVNNYWGANLNVNRGQGNFDELRHEYYRDPTVAIEAIKADYVDWRIENSAKNWATAYDAPAVTQNRIVLEEFPIRNVGIMQAFAFNIRRDRFKDPRVRRAFNYLFDFEDANKQLFFGQYTRIASYFQGTDLAATGLPQGKELEILETLRGQVPPEVFTAAYTNPAGGGADAGRDNRREALRLFKEAGYEVRDSKLVSVATGEPCAIELLGNNPLFERVFLLYKPSLERIGMTVNVRTVDDTQYENRLRNWDFDIITYAWGETLSPGSEQRGFWGSAAADQSGSENIIGIKNPAVDTIIEKVTRAASRNDLVAAVKALDRVLLWNHYVVPQWSYNNLRAAHWDRFSHAEPLPKYGIAGFPALWWWDAEKAIRADR
jgi:microcin C transport system substrate-binding protein